MLSLEWIHDAVATNTEKVVRREIGIFYEGVRLCQANDGNEVESDIALNMLSVKGQIVNGKNVRDAILPLFVGVWRPEIQPEILRAVCGGVEMPCRHGSTARRQLAGVSLLRRLSFDINGPYLAAD